MDEEKKQTPQEAVDAALDKLPLANFNRQASADMQAQLNNPDPSVATVARDTLAKVTELVTGKK